MRLQPPQLVDAPIDLLDAVASERNADSSIDAWLGVVSRLMRLPEATRTEIRNELREHLRERIRDLMLSGRDEREAVRTAIEELGETAQLARRFEAANQPPTGRYVMHGLLTLVGAGAIAAGVMTFTNNDTASTIASARYESDNVIVADPPKSLSEAKCELDAEASLREALDSVITQANVGLMVDWGHIESIGIDPSAAMGLSFREMPGTQALTLIAQAADNGPGGLDWRMRDGGLVEFGLRSELDRKEIELMTYDISKSITVISGAYAASIEEACSQVQELLTSMVEPENWVDNGGDLAQMRLVGGRLFVQAPKRMQGKVQWILDQLPDGEPDRKKENASAERAGDARQGVPIFAEVPLLKQNFARLEEVAPVLNPGDVVTMHIYELVQPELWSSATRRIDQRGMLRVLEIGEIRASGKTVEQLKSEIVRTLKEQAKAGEDPKVTVSLGSDESSER